MSPKESRVLAVTAVLAMAFGLSACVPVAAPSTPTTTTTTPINGVSATITVGDNPNGAAITPDGTKAYVTTGSDDTVSVINTATEAVSATIAVGDNPKGVAITPDGTKAYVTNQQGDTVSVIRIS